MKHVTTPRRSDFQWFLNTLWNVQACFSSCIELETDCIGVLRECSLRFSMEVNLSWVGWSNLGGKGMYSSTHSRFIRLCIKRKKHSVLFPCRGICSPVVSLCDNLPSYARTYFYFAALRLNFHVSTDFIPTFPPISVIHIYWCSSCKENTTRKRVCFQYCV